MPRWGRKRRAGQCCRLRKSDHRRLPQAYTAAAGRLPLCLAGDNPASDPSSLHQCLKRHAISRLPEIAGDKAAKKPFKRYPIGYFHLDFADALRRAWAVQSSSYAPIAVETRGAAASAPSARPVDPGTGSPPNSCSCESRVRASLSKACRLVQYRVSACWNRGHLGLRCLRFPDDGFCQRFDARRFAPRVRRHQG